MLEEMFCNSNLQLTFGTTVIIERGDCSSQQKSYANFDSLQRLCDLLNCRMIRVFAISEHGNGKGG